jgi:hypothetical protein
MDAADELALCVHPDMDYVGIRDVKTKRVRDLLCALVCVWRAGVSGLCRRVGNEMNQRSRDSEAASLRWLRCDSGSLKERNGRRIESWRCVRGCRAVWWLLFSQ